MALGTDFLTFTCPAKWLKDTLEPIHNLLDCNLSVRSTFAIDGDKNVDGAAFRAFLQRYCGDSIWVVLDAGQKGQYPCKLSLSVERKLVILISKRYTVALIACGKFRYFVEEPKERNILGAGDGGYCGSLGH